MHSDVQMSPKVIRVAVSTINRPYLAMRPQVSLTQLSDLEVGISAEVIAASLLREGVCRDADPRQRP